jgi:hypothetical protein
LREEESALMRVERHCVIDADHDTVWKVVSVGRNMAATLRNLKQMVEG